jgi:hypothetical protein
MNFYWNSLFPMILSFASFVLTQDDQEKELEKTKNEAGNTNNLI